MLPTRRRAPILPTTGRFRSHPRALLPAFLARFASSLADRQWSSHPEPNPHDHRIPLGDWQHRAPAGPGLPGPANPAFSPRNPAGAAAYGPQAALTEHAHVSGGPSCSRSFYGEWRGGDTRYTQVCHGSGWNSHGQSGAYPERVAEDRRYQAVAHRQGFDGFASTGSVVSDGQMNNSAACGRHGDNYAVQASFPPQYQQDPRPQFDCQDELAGNLAGPSRQSGGPWGGCALNSAAVNNVVYQQVSPVEYQHGADSAGMNQPNGWQQGSHGYGNGYQGMAGGSQQWLQDSSRQEWPNRVAPERSMEVWNDANFNHNGTDFWPRNYTPSQTEPVGSYTADVLERSAVTTNEEATSRAVVVDELDDICKEGDVDKAVEVLDLLEKRGILVDLPRYLCLMQVCGDPRCLEEARIVHGHLSRTYASVAVEVYNKMLYMYSKCGSMDDASLLFDAMPEKNTASWETMILGLADNGMGEEAVDLFAEFKRRGLRPSQQIFNAVFHACGVMGAVDEGMLHFETMTRDFGIKPDMENYKSIVEMLGASGHLDEALEFIESTVLDPSVDVWEALMILCRVNGNMELGDRCAEIVEMMDPSRLTKESKAGLVPVKATHQVKKEKRKLELLAARTKVHEYRCGDKSHPEKDRIYGLIWSLAPIMKEAGYIPETRFVLHDVDQESREDALLYHSERLATAHGLLTSPARTPIRVIKNLRICGDCHNAMKILSKIVGRQLIMRDAKRFHHFENGVCSCKDYW